MCTRPKDMNATSEESKGAEPYSSVLKNVSDVGTLVRSNDKNLFSRVKAAEPHSGTRLERNDTGSSGTDDVESGAGSAASIFQQP